MINFSAGLNAYTNWVAANALPFWSDAGFDKEHGRFFERMDLAGRPITEVPHRAIVQARQIFVFAQAETLGWYPGGELAEIAMASLLRDFHGLSAKSEGFAFSVGVSGSIISDVRDAYTHAFVLFALATLYQLNGDKTLLVIAGETICFLEAYLEDPVHGGFFDMFPIANPDKRQNPHMHLLEAYLALENAAPGRGYIERARKLVVLLQERLFDAQNGVLLEYFTKDWGTHPDPLKCDVFEPGHHFEWVWLLHEYEKKTADDMGFWITQLDENARLSGIAKDGLIFDEVGSDMRVRKSSHRVWSHAEALKAAAARHSNGDQSAGHFAGRMALTLMENFLGKPFAGGWTDHITAACEPLVNYVPASSLYHLFFAAAEIARSFYSPSAPVQDPDKNHYPCKNANSGSPQ